MAEITNEQLLKATIKPEDRELDQKRQEYARLESELADRELRLASIRAELSRFECQYLRDVGQRYAELDELKAQLAEHLAAGNRETTAHTKLLAKHAHARMKHSAPRKLTKPGMRSRSSHQRNSSSFTAKRRDEFTRTSLQTAWIASSARN